MRSLFALAVVALGSAGAAAGPVCALLDPEKHPRAALLEAKLLADSAATWVERNHIDKVLAEQRLQALFSPQGVGERVKFGTILKAELLVMVRSVKGEKEASLEVVVSETAGGLRLTVRTVPVTRSADADVTALLAAVRDGIKRHGEKIAEVVAVPPFVSRNLTFELEHLRGAYARLAEQVAFTRPGVVVVELAEAEALAKEIALAAPGTALARPLPVYLLGEYRHEGKGRDQTVTLKLRAERAGKPVGEPVTKTVKPDGAAAAVREWAGGVVLAGKPPPAGDPKAEVGQLLARSDDFHRLGHMSESLAMVEAAILLSPGDPQLRMAAIKITALALNAENRLYWPWATDVKVYERGRQLYARGLEHFEAFVTLGGDLRADWKPELRARLERDLLGEWARLGRGDGEMMTLVRHLMRQHDGRHSSTPELDVLKNKSRLTTEAMRARWRESQQLLRETLLRVIPVLARDGLGREVEFVGMVLYPMPPVERYELLERLLIDLKGFPRNRERALLLLYQERQELGLPLSPQQKLGTFVEVPHPGHPEFLELLDRLTKFPNGDIQSAARSVKIETVRDLGQFAARTATTHLRIAAGGVRGTGGQPAAADAGPRLENPLVRFTPVNLEFEGRPANFSPGWKIMDVVPLGGVDLVVSEDSYLPTEGVYLMKEKGKLRRLWSGARYNQISVYSDGQFAWITVWNAERPTLMVFDPATERLHEFTEKHGLPVFKPGQGVQKPMLPKILVAPLGPGRACLAGSLLGETPGRTWVAVATFDRTTGPSVKVIHEALVAPKVVDPEFGLDTSLDGADVAFVPFEFGGYKPRPAGEGPEARLLLWRRTPPLGDGSAARYAVRPLVIYPDRPFVEVQPFGPDDQGRSQADTVVPSGGKSRYSVSARGAASRDKDGVWRIVETLPNGASRYITEERPTNRVTEHFVHNGYLYITTTKRDTEMRSAAIGSGQWWCPHRWWRFDPATRELELVATEVPNGEGIRVSAHYGTVLLGVRAKGEPSFHAVEFVEPFRLPPPPTPESIPPPRPRGVTFTPLNPGFAEAEGGAELAGRIKRLLPAGGADVLLAGDALFVLKEKGKPRRVWAGTPGDTFALHTDGKLVWVLVTRGKQHILLVVDPESVAAYEITEKHGLPKYTPGPEVKKDLGPVLLLAVGDPGRACLAGTLAGGTPGRCWVGVATYDPATGPRVRVLQEFPNHPTRLTAQTRTTADGKPEARVIFQRLGVGAAIYYVIDPDRGTVTLPKTPESGWRSVTPTTPEHPTVVHGGIEYRFKEGVGIVRGSGTGEVVWMIPATGGTYGSGGAVYRAGRLHVAAGMHWAERPGAGDPGVEVPGRAFRWWAFDPETEDLELLSVDVPPVTAIVESSLHGLVVLAGRPGGDGKLYAVTFTAGKK